MDWFRLYHEFSTDPKVQSMSEAMQRRLVMLMCLRCSNTLETLQEQDICFALRISETKLAETKALFIRKRFIDEGWNILQWDKRQKPSDSSTERVRRHREAKKRADETACNVTETAQRREEEKRVEEPKTYPNPDGLGVASDADDPIPPAIEADMSPQRPKLTRPQCPHQQILALYHELLPANPTIRDWTPARADHLRCRWNEDPKRQTLDWWRRFFGYIGQSAFLTGRATSGNRKPFTPGLDWICKAENFAKIREGRFHDEEAA
ncbi:hypothetical protein [Burkholderia multivorans]|uniref:hypothetical protein n=1 Tax=Burkholderia multivorans TaxID=87883 RepID=UPI0020B260FF|nr:hypothetical protein [Burkholderia multivorans]